MSDKIGECLQSQDEKSNSQKSVSLSDQSQSFLSVFNENDNGNVQHKQNNQNVQ